MKKMKFAWMGGFGHIIVVALHDVINPCSFSPDFRIRLYATIPGYYEYLARPADLANQLAFKHRNMRVLEIGSGKGHCTKAILDVLGSNFASYTCTGAEMTSFDLYGARYPPGRRRGFISRLSI